MRHGRKPIAGPGHPARVVGGGGALGSSLYGVRLRLFIAMSVAIALVIGATVLIYDQLDGIGEGGDQIVSGPGGTSGSPSQPAEVHGTVTAVLIADALIEPREVPTPLTVTSERGFGNGGEVTSVEVDGEPTTIVWDGGRPFSLTSGGALRLDPVSVVLVPTGLLVGLGGGNHTIVPGTYQLDTPVAVGREGVATPHDTVTFTAGEASLLEARGDASIIFGPDAPRRFVGPGTVLLSGTFEVTDDDGTRSETAIATGVDAFDLTFTPDGEGGWTVDGVVALPAAP
jgi:hypothetical protein